MSKRTYLSEAVAAAPTKKENRWRVVVARPGKGSSGTYSEDLFKEYASVMVPAGAQSFINHDWDRNPKDMIGIFPEAAYYDEEAHEVVAYLEVFSHWKDFVDEVGPHCGISLFALGEQDEDGNVTAFLPDPLNGADLVARPGLEGSGLAEKLYESALKVEELKRPGARQEDIGKEIKMDQEMRDAFKAVTDALAALVAEKKTAEDAEAQVKANEAAVVSAVEAYDAAVKLIDAADLLPVQVESLRAAAKAGEDVAPLIEAAKKVKDEAIKAVTESADTGHVQGATKTKFGAWK